MAKSRNTRQIRAELPKTLHGQVKDIHRATERLTSWDETISYLISLGVEVITKKRGL